MTKTTDEIKKHEWEIKRCNESKKIYLEAIKVLAKADYLDDDGEPRFQNGPIGTLDEAWDKLDARIEIAEKALGINHNEDPREY